MNKHATLLPTLVIGLTLSIGGCKKQDAVRPAPAPVAAEAASTAQPTPAAPLPTTGQPASGAGNFDVNSVPIVATALPPFPYVGLPEALEKDPPRDENSDFDRVYVVAGTELRAVEGRINKRNFSLSSAKLSRLAAERNYDSVMKDIGATLVNKVQPSDPAFREAHSDFDLGSFKGTQKLGVLGTSGKYSTYLLRTPETNIWVVIAIDELNVSLVAVEEKQMTQSVRPLSAAAMRTELATSGHVALYLHFDTDKAVIRIQDKPTIAEVKRLLSEDTALKLLIEGHTDNSGDSPHNSVLSEQRARAVRDSLVESGIDQQRLAAVGLGDTRPVADNKDDAGRARNRRVELVKRT
jgi:OOP family OmpA-OmpF porin